MADVEYVYTKKGEERARRLGLDVRKEGAIAMYGDEPVSESGSVAKAWLESGYIREKE